MSSKLFVGGLSWDTTDQSLAAAFSAFGTVTDAKVILDRDTGRSRGFGFVTFDAPADAQKAIAEMDGAELDGRSVRVNEAEDKPRRSSGGGGGGGGGRGGYGGGGGGGGFDGGGGGGGGYDGGGGRGGPGGGKGGKGGGKSGKGSNRGGRGGRGGGRDDERW